MNYQALLLAALATTVTACGGETSSASSAQAASGQPASQAAAAGGLSAPSYVPYLRTYHDHYSDYGNSASYPLNSSINGDQVYWDIQADSETDASSLAAHIQFMADALDQGQIPRSWDKLFVLEAFLHEQISTTVTVDGTRVSIYKTAANACAYQLMTTHAAAVSAEFFATGDISADHSAAADAILAMDACADQREAAEAFIALNWQPR